MAVQDSTCAAAQATSGSVDEEIKNEAAHLAVSCLFLVTRHDLEPMLLP